jgi:hypothetical protein
VTALGGGAPGKPLTHNRWAPIEGGHPRRRVVTAKTQKLSVPGKGMRGNNSQW